MTPRIRAVLVRHAAPDDAEAIERIRTDTWRATYRGLLPDALLDRLTYEGSRRRARLATLPLSEFALVAELDDAVVGYCFGGPSRTTDAEYPGEVYAIYVQPDRQGRGIGRALLQGGARELFERQRRGMLIWVLRENAPSRHFYERMGGRWVRDEPREIDGVAVTESGYGWIDIERLAREAAIR